jgi:hypothetical protein
MMELEDGKGVWQRNLNLPWNQYKLLQRDKFEELVTMMMDAYPDHEITEWLKRGYCMNEGDSTIAFKSLLGSQTLNHHLDIWDDEDQIDYDAYWNGVDDDIDWDEDW